MASRLLWVPSRVGCGVMKKLLLLLIVGALVAVAAKKMRETLA